MSDSMQEMVERLAIEQAVYKAMGADLDTRDPTSLRGQVNEGYRRLYEQTGATSFEVRLRGQKVGTYGFSRVKGTPGRTVAELRVTDMDALRAWKSDELNEFVTAWVDERLADIAVQYAAKTGELPDGVEYVTETVPATPDGIRPNGTLRVSVEKVAEALGDALPATIAGLLEGGA